MLPRITRRLVVERASFDGRRTVSCAEVEQAGQTRKCKVLLTHEQRPALEKLVGAPTASHWACSGPTRLRTPPTQATTEQNRSADFLAVVRRESQKHSSRLHFAFLV